MITLLILLNLIEMGIIKFGKFEIKSKWLLLSLFIISVIVRLPNLDRPLSKHHEFNAALVLIPIDNWNQSSPLDFNYGPVMSYQNENDLYINNITIDFTEQNGSYYYLSFPVLTYLIPYLTFQIGLPATPLGLQILNMLLHLACAYLLFKTVHFITKERLSKEKKTTVALLASSIYLFSPTPMWFHGNGYTHHTLVVLFILYSIYITLKIFYSEIKPTLADLFQLFIALTLAMLTAWIGFLLSGIICVLALLRIKQGNKLLLVFAVAFIAAISSFSFIIWHYSSIIGFENLINYFNNRFFTRTTFDDNDSGFFQTVYSIGKWYVIGYLPILLFVTYQFISRKSIRLKISEREKTFFWITILLAFSHHILFGNFTIAHNYSVLVDGIFISVLGAILFNELFYSISSLTNRTIGVVLLFTMCIGQYYFINRPGETSQNGDLYSNYQDIGDYIRINSTKDDVLFTIGLDEKPAPQVIYYAKRNFYQLNDLKEVQKIIDEKSIKRAKVFTIKNMKVQKLESIIAQ